MATESSNKKRRALLIGKYEVQRHIATGGMGAVYSAVDTELKRPVALKVLAPEIAVKPNMLERFRREARSAAKLKHENIVAIFECGYASDTHFLALEFVDGVDLHEFIREKGKIDVEEARQILIQATMALAHAHHHGVVHRDIKPSNFLLADKDGKPLVKLTDFGLARQENDDDFRVTKAGTTVGTVDYMSPEQARNSASADVRSDIYSLGCTFYHMLAGNAPFPEGSLPERLMKHAEAEPPDVREFNEDVSAGLAYIVEKMLAKKPEDRYQTPSELLKDLQNPSKLEPKTKSNDRLQSLAQLADVEKRKRPVRRPMRKRPSSTTVDAPIRTQTLPIAQSPSRSPTRKRKRSSQQQQFPWTWVIAGLLGTLIVVIVMLASIGSRTPKTLPKQAIEKRQTAPPLIPPVRPQAGF